MSPFFLRYDNDLRGRFFDYKLTDAILLHSGSIFLYRFLLFEICTMWCRMYRRCIWEIQNNFLLCYSDFAQILAPHELTILHHVDEFRPWFSTYSTEQNCFRPMLVSLSFVFLFYLLMAVKDYILQFKGPIDLCTNLAVSSCRGVCLWGQVSWFHTWCVGFGAGCYFHF